MDRQVKYSGVCIVKENIKYWQTQKQDESLLAPRWH